MSESNLTALAKNKHTSREKSWTRSFLSQQSKSIPHFERRLYHAFMGLVCFSLYAFLLNQNQALLCLCLIGGTMLLFDIFRIRKPKLQIFSLRYFGKLMRQEELTTLSGNSYYILGLLLITAFFPKPIVLLSILYLAIGDPVAALVGTLFGKRKVFSNKTIEGSLACYVVCTMITCLFSLFYLKLTIEQVFLFSFLGGFIGTIGEIIPSRINDNFMIPVVSAILLSLLSSAVSFF